MSNRLGSLQNSLKAVVDVVERIVGSLAFSNEVKIIRKSA